VSAYRYATLLVRNPAAVAVITGAGLAIPSYTV
jgi:hypothetical protein